MQIASKSLRAVCLPFSALLLVLIAPVSTRAADANAIAPPPPSVADAPAVAPGAPAVPPNSAKRPEDLTPLENKVTDAAKNVVKQMGSIDSVSLDDLNTARQTVVKLEALIDIEKHLVELDKVRGERSSEKSVASAIPASALIPPTAIPSPPPSFTHVPVTAPEGGFSELGGSVPSQSEVTRIIGAGGHYMAVVQGKTVRAGDKLSDGSSVVSITARDVEVKSRGGTLRHLKIKGVDQVFGPTL